MSTPERRRAARGRRGERALGARRRDAELEAGTSAHYDDPAYYAATYKRRLEDVVYYVELAERRAGPVLEYGCGNGRITIPLARAGLEVFGVDLSRPMLDDLQARLEREPPEVSARVRTRRGDMRSVRLGRRFPLVICPFNAFLHLYTRRDVERFFASAKRHLAPRGELVFDVSIPEPSELARDPRRAYLTRPFRYPDRDGRLVRYAERFDYDKVRQILFVAMEFSAEDDGERWMTPLAHRQFYPQELEALLHYNGLRVTKLVYDFESAPPSRDSRVLVVHARARS